jgi:hypothetical protein
MVVGSDDFVMLMVEENAMVLDQKTALNGYTFPVMKGSLLVVDDAELYVTTLGGVVVKLLSDGFVDHRSSATFEVDMSHHGLCREESK